MVSHHHTPGPNINARSSHVTDMDNVYQHSPRMSRLANHRPLRDSMLAYTQRMREIAQFRHDSTLLAPAEPVSVLPSQSQHQKSVGVWKTSPRHHHHHHPRRHHRPVPFDELVARQAKEEPRKRFPKKKAQRYSDPSKIPFPSVSPEPTQDRDNSQVQISFVSASDLFELVNFSLRSKPSRNESMKQSRYEDSLKLVKESDLWRSLSSSPPLKPEKDDDDGDTKETLVVHGVPSPRDMVKISPKTKKWVSSNKNGEKVRKREEGDKAAQHHENQPVNSDRNQSSSHDLLRERHLILLHPQKLRHRPKRAKRMALHRSLLGVIPEDERRQQEEVSAQAQKTPTPRMPAVLGVIPEDEPRQQEEANAQTQKASTPRLPVIPTSSSLTAIKSMRKAETMNTASVDSKTPRNDLLNTTDYKPIENKLSKLTPVQEITHETSRKTHRTNTESTQNGELGKGIPKIAISSRHDKVHTHTDTVPRTKQGSGKSSGTKIQVGFSRARASRGLTGQSMPLLAPESRARAQRKFSKLIFLRDTMDHACPR